MATSQYEQELTDYLKERIKPGLNKGAIPLLARSIAKEIARRDPPGDESVNGGGEEPREDEGDEPRAEEDVDAGAEGDEDEPRDEDEADEEDAVEDEDEDDADEDAEDEDEDAKDEDEDGTQGKAPAVDFEAEMHELQEELGEDWILRFSVQGDDAWLTAEKADGSQRVEAPTAEVLTEAVELLNEGGGRSR